MEMHHYDHGSAAVADKIIREGEGRAGRGEGRGRISARSCTIFEVAGMVWFGWRGTIDVDSEIATCRGETSREDRHLLACAS